MSYIKDSKNSEPKDNDGLEGAKLEHPAPRPGMTLKPFDSLPETVKSQPAVTNQTPDATGTLD